MASGGFAAVFAVRYRKRKGPPVITSHFLSAGKKRSGVCPDKAANPFMAASASKRDEPRNERHDDESSGDDELMVDAAKVLQEFRDCPRPPKSLEEPIASIRCVSRTQISRTSSWTIRKARSRVPRRARSTSLETSNAAPVSESNSLELCEAQKVGAPDRLSSPSGRSKEEITCSKVKEDASCSSIGLPVEVVQREEEKDLQVDMDLLNDERLHKLVSDSSNEFPSRGSPVERPSSPLAVLSRPAETPISLWPTFEASLTGRSAFQKVVPVRPLKKATVPRKLKVEDKAFESANSEQTEVKPISRKKLKPTGSEHPQLPLLSMKSETLDASLTLDFDPRLFSIENGKSALCDEMKSVIPDPVIPLDDKTLSFAFSKEAGSAGRLGYRGVGKPKIELNEVEQEARRLRRAQANRESARQTIRRKQVLTEERSRRAETLSKENETLKKEVELLQRKHKSLIEQNAHLTQQIAKAAVNCEKGPAPLSPSLQEKDLPSSRIQFCLPPHVGGLPFNSACMFAVVGQLSEAAEIPLTEMDIGSRSYAPVLGLHGPCGSGTPAGFLSVSSGSPAKSTFVTSYIPDSVANASASSAASMMIGNTSLERSVSLPVQRGDCNFSLVPAERGPVSASSLASYRSGDFGHLSDDLKRGVDKGESSYPGFGVNLRTHLVNLTSPCQAGTELRGAVSLPIRKPGDNNSLSFLTTSGPHYSRSHNVAALNPSKITYSRYPLLGSVGISKVHEQPTLRETESQKAAAAATEARRRRRELFRSKHSSKSAVKSIV